MVNRYITRKVLWFYGYTVLLLGFKKMGPWGPLTSQKGVLKFKKGGDGGHHLLFCYSFLTDGFSFFLNHLPYSSALHPPPPPPPPPPEKNKNFGIMAPSLGSFHFTPPPTPGQLKVWGKDRRRQAGADFIYPNEILPAYKWIDECKY